MPWIILVVSAVFEAVWATALSASDGFSDLVPTIVFIIGIIVSVAGLAVAMKTIPLGVAYAVWVGIGAALTVSVAVALGEEPASPLKLLFIAGIIGAVIGLKLVDTKPAETRPDPAAD